MDTLGNLVDSPSHRCGESIFEYEYCISENSKPKSKRIVRDLGQSDLCKNIEKTCLLPYPSNKSLYTALAVL